MANKSVNAPVNVNLTVQLPVSAYNFLEKNAKNGDIQETLARWVQYFIVAQSGGGFILEPQDVDYLNNLSDGKKVRNSRDIVKLVEQGMKREDGQYDFVVSIDPAFIQPLTEYAEQSGLTLQALIQNGCAMIWSCGWLYDLSPKDGRNIPFTESMLRDAALVAGKDSVDSSDIADMIAEVLSSRSAKAKAA